jgi:hypothetical protein
MKTLLDAFKNTVATKRIEPDLDHYLYKADFIEKALDLKVNTCIFSGLKGAGKTATYRALTEIYNDVQIILPIDVERLRVEAPILPKRQNVYKLELERLLSLSILKELVDKENLLPNLLKKSINKFIDPILKKMESFGRRFTGFNLFFVGLSFDLSKRDSTILSLGPNENDQMHKFLTSISELGIKIRIVIDDPEDIFFTDNNINYDLLGGLWLASAQLTYIIPNLKVIVLMKSNIADMVRTKIYDYDWVVDSYGTISWNDQKLIELIKNRLHHYCGCDKDKWANRLFKYSSSKKVSEALNIVLSNIRNGPREMFRLFYKASEFQIEQTGDDKITVESLESVLDNFSRESYEQFNINYSEQYPGIESLIPLLLREDHNFVFKKNSFNVFFKTKISSDPIYAELLKNSWLQPYYAATFPNLLQRLGIISFIYDNKQILPYMDNYNIQNFEMSKQFEILPIVKRAISS